MMWGARRIHTAVLNTSTVHTCRAERLNVPTQQTQGSDAPAQNVLLHICATSKGIIHQLLEQNNQNPNISF